jgi:hypothetical protein
MPSIRDERAVAAGTNVANILAGSQFEFMAVPSHIAVYAVMDTADAGSVFLDASFGNVIEGDSMAIPLFTLTLGPNTNEHQLVSAVAAAGDRLVIRIRNTDAINAAATRTLVKITPLM